MSRLLVQSTKSILQATQKRSVSAAPSHTSPSTGKSRIIHAIGTMTWFGIATGSVLAVSPLDQEVKSSHVFGNGCYHSHLHPR